MSLNGYSLGTILQWANNNFFADFQCLTSAKHVTIQLHKTSKASGPGYLKALVIGTSTDEKGAPTDVLAWLHDNHMIVGYVTKVGSRLQETRYDSLEPVLQGVEEFKQPFRWVLEAGCDGKFAKLEVLVRYYFLVKGSQQAVKGHVGDFQEHFGEVCRIVAAAQRADGEESDVHKARDFPSQTLPSYATASSKEVIYDFETFVDRLGQQSSTVDKLSHSSKTLKTCIDNEKTYGSFTVHQQNLKFDVEHKSVKSDLQEPLKAEVKNLRERVQSLDNRLMMAEGRARKAEQDAALWKREFEQLRAKVEGYNST